MTTTPAAVSHDGLLRIHIRAQDQVPHQGRWWRKMVRHDLAHQIVRWAHEAGLPMAMVQRSHLGFVDHGPIIDNLASDQPHPHAMVLIEIAGTETTLTAFVDRHRSSFAHAHIQFLPTLNWSVHHRHPAHHDPHAPRLALDRRQEQEEATHEEHT